MDVAATAPAVSKAEVGPLPTEPGSRTAARSLVAVVGVSVLVAALTWHLDDAGPGFVLADAVLVVALVGGVARGRPGGAAWLLGLASVWLAAMTCFRASDWAIAVAMPGALVTLGALALTCAWRTPAQRVSEVPRAAFQAFKALPAGIVDGARLPVRALDASTRGHALGVLRGLLIGTPVALAFALVLAADAPFRRALAGMLGGAGHGLDFMFWTVATLCALLVAHAVLWRLREAHATEAVSVAAAPAGPYRATSDLEGFTQAVGPAGPRLRPLTWSVVLAQVVAVFGVYVAVSARSLFATHAHLREHGTTTYSAYLHEGFGQVTLAALLAVACVGVGHVMLRPRGETTARIAGGRGLVVVELLLLSLVAVTLASCAHRLSLYEEAYGFTYQRLGVWVLQLGIAGLLAMMAARCLARAWQGFASALVWAGLALLVGAGSFDADLWIARRNLALVPAAARGACGDFPTNLVHADLDYLATLSEDARSVVHEGGLCPWETRQLDEAWIDKARAHRLGGWRSLRGLGVR